ncbi:MAG TPA: RNA-binding S4 domain-containing protein [Desulfuromonadaceae bacterium]
MTTSFAITTEHIKLDSLLKGVNAVGSGGEAKLVIASGLVEVNGAVELRRGRKLYPGDRVRFGKREYRVERGELQRTNGATQELD